MKKVRNSFLKNFTSIEVLTFLYVFFSALYIFCFYNKIENPIELLLYRISISAIIIFLAYLYKIYPTKLLEFIRFLFPLIAITYWYPETYYLTHDAEGGAIFISNLDPFFDRLDIKLFRCTPAMDFSEALPYSWFSEIMYFAYFFYYIIYVYIAFYFFFFLHKESYKSAFIMLFSFFLFYIVFVFIPVEGPQFYWKDADVYVPEGYFFSWLQKGLQSMGEMPTGAFPSSHVGLTMIFMIILFKNKRNVFWIFLPVTILLCMSTVYIKAHYLIDILISFIVTPFVYLLAVNMYKLTKKRIPVMDNNLITRINQQVL